MTDPASVHMPHLAKSYAQFLRAVSAGPNLRKGEATRWRLLASMATLVNAESSETAPRIADITEDANVAQGTFYRYFTDFTAALEELLDGFVDFLQDGMTASRVGKAGSPESVRAATLSYVYFFRANVGLMRRLMAPTAAATASRERFHRLNKDWNHRVARAISRRRAQLTGEPPAPAARLVYTAYVLGGMVDEFLAQIYLRKDPALLKLATAETLIADILTEVWCQGAYGNFKMIADQLPEAG